MTFCGLRSYPIAVGWRDRTMNTPTSIRATPASCGEDGSYASKSQPANNATIGVMLLNTDVCATPIVLSAWAHTK